MHIFLLVGQSNMAGRGTIEPEDLISHPRVKTMAEDRSWRPAIAPLHFDKPSIAGVGPGQRFAQVWAEAHSEKEVGLVPCAFGGTSLDEWHPDGPLFQNAVSRCLQAQKNGELKAILWHQGESDIHNGLQDSYGERLPPFIAALREALGAPEVPFILGEIAHFYGGAESLNRQLPQIVATVPNTALVTSEDLAHGGDDVHLDSRSARELGERYAHALLKLTS